MNLEFSYHDAILAPFYPSVLSPSFKRSSSRSFRPVVCGALAAAVDMAEAPPLLVNATVAGAAVRGRDCGCDRGPGHAGPGHRPAGGRARKVTCF